MFIDLHIHEKLFSRCSSLSLDNAVEYAKKAQLDAICITDHNVMTLQNSKMIEKLDFPVFIGVEITTTAGDMIAFGIPKVPNLPIHPQDLIDYTHKHNGFCYVAHPYRNYIHCLNDEIYELNDLQGIEVFNGGNEPYENNEARKAFRKFDNILALAGSDAHIKRAVGCYAMYFENTVSSVEDLVVELKAGRCCPVEKKEDGEFHIIKNI